MKISALEEYGLRCALRLAMASDGGRLTVQEIAEHEGLTVPHVAKLMSVLREAGLVDSVRGRAGGFVLSRPASEISVDEVLAALGEPLFSSEYCDSHSGSRDVCARSTECSIRPVWQIVGKVIHDVLRGTSLADLCGREPQVETYLQLGSVSALAGAGIPPTGTPVRGPAGVSSPDDPLARIAR